MAAYGAAVSLLNTLSQLQKTPNYPHPQIAVLLKGVHSLKRFLVENREVKSEFETQIRDAIYEAQDIIDSHMCSTHSLSPSEAEISNKSFYGDLERVIQKINSIAEMTAEEFNHQTLYRKISNSVWRNSKEIDCAKKYPVVGRDKDINELKDRLMKGSEPDGLQVVPIVGIAGMGKTALAHRLLKDPEIGNHFDAIGWVNLSIKYNKYDKLLDILASMQRLRIGIPQDRNEQLFELQYNWSDEIHQQTEKQLTKQIYNSLKNKKYLILLDDIRDVVTWNDLKELFPNSHNGSRILLTTRDKDVAPACPHRLDRLSEKDTFILLVKIVFAERWPRYLPAIVHDMARNCRGFPHAVVIVGKLLSCAKLTTAYWEIVLSSIIPCKNDVDLIEALVSLTYNHLPQRLKVCLLYMAIFPYNYAIPLRKIYMQWVVEGFMEEDKGLINMGVAGLSFIQISRRGFLVSCVEAPDMLTEKSRIAEEVFHDFLVRKAKDEKFFLVINKDTSYALLQGDTTYNQQRRLCIQQNIHHFMKDLSTIYLNSSARSLIYSGPENLYRLRAWSKELKQLEVLDALKIGFYTFPPEILELVQLKYLAFSYNGQFPAAVCNLQKLQVLIVSQYLDLKCYGVPSYIPAEIWNLKELMQLQVVGSDLPEPPSGTSLEKLLYLLDVSARSCTQNIFERIPNVKTLEVRIDSLQDVGALNFFSYLDILHNLRLFNCIVMYPDIGPQVVPSSIPVYPSTLTELTLSGCGFPWEHMRVIAALPKLQYLKLKTYAFQGPEWEVKTDEFPKLECLHLEDMDFQNWTCNSSIGSSFPNLKFLIIRHCYKLRHIPSVFADSSTLQLLEVVDCNTSAMNSALEIKEEIRKRGNHSTQFGIYSTGDY